ncbi:MAG: fatty acid desaturase [Dongiaceae bacterium]
MLLGIGQIASSFLPLLAVMALMYLTLQVSYGLTLLLAVLAAGLTVRVFIIQHDCGHGSFFRSRRTNDALGWLCSLFTLTPYTNWRRQHAGHHANWNNLDRRQSGSDIYSTCLTTEEYGRLGRWRRAAYRLVRNPLVSLVLLPPLVFLLLYRLPFDTPKAWKQERRGVHLTNLALATVLVALGATLGFRAVLLVQLPIWGFAAIIGVWLFSLQHRFEHSYWARQGTWSADAASLLGSSHLKLPRLMQWFTGNIGFHHVHHLNPRIPNYRLEACHAGTPAIQGGPVLTLRAALGAWRYALWDEAAGKMVRFPRR